MTADNLFAPLPDAASGEVFDELLRGSAFRLERIVSTGQATPPGEWLDQPLAEGVVLLAGRARLRFDDEPAARELVLGDHVLIAPHRRHRVEWTDPEQPTVWLAIHYRAASGATA
jgi:cupin 2 domain-containing protein